jgi:DNA-directed RNA polymerase specialized sigma24 family protein
MNALAHSILRGLADPADAVASALERLVAEGSADAERFERLVSSEARTLRTKTLRNRRQEEPIGLIPDLAELEESLATGRGLPLSLASFPEDFDYAVRGLPESERDAFILTDLRGLTVREAADVLDVSKSTVDRWADAARDLLGEELTS